MARRILEPDTSAVAVEATAESTQKASTEREASQVSHTSSTVAVVTFQKEGRLRHFA